jgi:hypothetical protein
MDRAHRTQLVLGSVFTALGTLLVALGLAQLAFWWNGALSGLTIEPIVLPMGVVFLAVGVPKLLTRPGACAGSSATAPSSGPKCSASPPPARSSTDASPSCA